MDGRNRRVNGSDVFFVRAAEEAWRYGSDPWVFLRELVQNSRDAHAHHIDVSVAVTQESEEVACEDDGIGMNEDVAEQFLLRLYASTKVEDGNGNCIEMACLMRLSNPGA